jgi:4-hydroxy-tetrahydrodipicolinate synthase
MLYNVPGRTGVDILPDTVCRLFDECDNIFGIKEATGSVERAIELLSKRPDLYLFSGDDAIDYPILANGGRGITSVTSNLLPDLKSKLVHSALQGDYKISKELSDMLYPINKVLFCESNPIPIKAAMYIAGLTQTLEYRLPLVSPSTKNMKKIEEILKNYTIVGVD